MFTSGSHTPGPGQHGFFAFESTNGTDYESLVRQNSELLRALGELERKCATLREENNLLRKSSSPETEEKVKRLKRKNAELAVIAKRLEERARKLQEANLKVVNTPAPLRGSTLEQCKKAFARQRAKDLEEHADALLAKDKEIAALQQECRELHAKIGPGKNYSDRWNLTDFEHLLRESQKEVLRLQRQLAASTRDDRNLIPFPPSLPPSELFQQKTEGSVPRAVDEQRNSSEGRKLIQIPECIVSDQESQQQIQQLETELNKKRKEYENLEQEVRKRQKRCQELETDLQDVQSKNIRLVEDNVRLNQKTLQLEKVELENADLKVWLREVTQERDWALEENQRLKAKLENLEQVLKHMREVGERRQQLELEHEEALTSLKFKQDEVRRLQQAQVEAKKEHEGMVQLLENTLDCMQVKVRELEEKCRSQSEQFSLLSQELERFRLQAGKINFLTSSIATSEQSSSPCFSQIHFQSGVEPHEKKASPQLEDRYLQGSRSPAVAFLTTVCKKGLSKPALQHETAKSESTHSSPKSCLTQENKVDTASEVEELDIDSVSPVPEPENRGPAKLQVFIARYSYNPFDGPNENPEAELPLTAGEYIYVYGEMDEDGFYEVVGELMDGRRGLVPSNFVERISDEDMLTFHPPEANDLSHSSFQEISFHSGSERNLPLSANSTEKSDVSIPEEEDPILGKAEDLLTNGFDTDVEELGDDAVPYPRKLTLIKQLAKSIIVSWEPPLVPAGWGDVWSYNIFVDKELRLNVKFGLQTKAVIERLDLNLKAYRISVQSVTEKGNSDELRCSILVGRDVCVAPTRLRLQNVTATSTELSWLPSNSNYAHAVHLNEEEYEVVKMGNYSYSFRNLRPNVRYRVKVEARPHRTPWELPLERRERKCAITHFTTLTAGPPDAPLDVQVEAGLSPGIILITWLPVTIDAAGTSNGVRVTGYAVYADGNKVIEVSSPTAGSILVGPSQIEVLQASKELTVRTMSPYGESADSVPVKLPSTLSVRLPKTMLEPSLYSSPLQSVANSSLSYEPSRSNIPKQELNEISQGLRSQFPPVTSCKEMSKGSKGIILKKCGDEVAVVHREGATMDKMLKITKDSESAPGQQPKEVAKLPRDLTAAEETDVRNTTENSFSPEKQNTFCVLGSNLISANNCKEQQEDVPELENEQMNTYCAESSRGSDLSDILEEDEEEELCSDTPGNEDLERPEYGANNESAGKNLTIQLDCHKVKSHESCETDSDEEILEKILALPLQKHCSKKLFSIPEVTEEEEEEEEEEEDKGSCILQTNGKHQDLENILPPDSKSCKRGEQDSNLSHNSAKYSGVCNQLQSKAKLYSGSSHKAHNYTEVNSNSKMSHDQDKREFQERSCSKKQMQELKTLSYLKDMYNMEVCDGFSEVSESNCKKRWPPELRKSKTLVQSPKKTKSYMENDDIHSSMEIDIEYSTEEEERLPFAPLVVHLGQVHSGWCREKVIAEHEEMSDGSSQSNGRKRELKRQETVEDEVFDLGFIGSRSSPLSSRRKFSPAKGVNPLGRRSGKNSLGVRMLFSKPLETLRSTSPEIKGNIEDNVVRIFVALFDYDPVIMSPNPDAAEEELPFREGQIIKVHGDKDADGFYRGESVGRTGYVPCNMVSEIQVEDEEIREQLLQHGYLPADTPLEKLGNSSLNRKPPRRAVPPPKPRRSKKVQEKSGPQENPKAIQVCQPQKDPVAPRTMVAVFDYDPKESSPNVDVEAELSFSAGDIITVFGDMDDDGFFYGELNGQQGLVPSNFLEVVPENGAETARRLTEDSDPHGANRERPVS
uniref:RIMS-binding protein 2 n=1 Tax=Latimeria chalumnae TaxID=7897 RepID=H3BAH8_LATCH